MTRLNRSAYEKLVAENIARVEKEMVHSPEKDHILLILRSSPDREYGTVEPETAREMDEIIELLRMWRAADIKVGEGVAIMGYAAELEARERLILTALAPKADPPEPVAWFREALMRIANAEVDIGESFLVSIARDVLHKANSTCTHPPCGEPGEER